MNYELILVPTHSVYSLPKLYRTFTEPLPKKTTTTRSVYLFKKFIPIQSLIAFSPNQFSQF